ncbi:ABC transporter permease [Bradyrhizobium sp. U87765 SZCCT0131]|uniref:ABC transporter permease n=1 Tax=unclassified Bradyrhizobium TaxID=2631580 RepID=UPI001BA6ABC6|nr:MULTISPECIES: ABC transporter permease [unclassified Bradyrhizobium]MBR1221614.1 ABC transporter permease [Bradyrhizobium sp. U87765 SZCCT0131]MBR1264463.1 ABC transporter permease [Bradyrhizobium sp. U87765 SZCCT0134]MBR1304630.1 ABC transporter permease [Bradyrhizobium sp. U87765 SZCCT0110]MBR1322513.1 ABC transporter permease [Bradyrhizobium sp. U87765 SZCCT0109]MBR1346559.1 ABC transporter permease [Bradyrhizobium sp. U87765 SZCCT0048]
MTDVSKPMAAPPRAFMSDDVVQVFYRLLAALLICVALSLLSDSFLNLNNILNVLRQASLMFFIAAGLTLVVLTAGLDLSVGANVALSACLAGTVIKLTGSPALGVLTGLAVGGAVGLLNGLMVTALRIPSFIATYGMLWVLHGLTYWYMAGDTIHGFPPGFRQIGSGYLLGLPIPVYLLLIFLAIGTIFAQRTTWGQEIYAIGANPVAARLSGIPVSRRLVLVYVMSGLMAGLASIIFLARLNSAEADIGESLTLPAIAAVLIGGTSLFGGIGTVFGTFVGALILTLVLNGMNLLQVSASWQPLVTGVIVILAVWLDMKTRRRGQ